MLAVVAAVVLLWQQDRLPLDSARQRLLTSWERVTLLVQLPLADMVPTPAPQDETLPVAGTSLATPRPSATASPTIRAGTPTAEPTFTSTAPPIASVTTELAGTYTVASGDSLMAIGGKVNLPWQAIASLNGLTENSVLRLGQVLRLPTATPQVGTDTTPTAGAVASPTGTGTTAPPTPTPSGAPTQAGSFTYTLQSGDTLMGLGQRFGVDWEAIAQVNNIRDTTALRSGDKILIPASGATRQATATPTRRPSSTPPPPSSTPAPTLPPVVLSSPADGSRFGGADDRVQLAWETSLSLPAGAQYQITVRWTADGTAQQHVWQSSATMTQVPQWLWQQADQPERRYVWSVDIAQLSLAGDGSQRITILSSPGPSRSFFWN